MKKTIRTKGWLLLLVFTASLLFVCCSDKRSSTSIQFDPSTVQSKGVGEVVCKLGENLTLLKNISDIVFISDTSFLITSQSNAILYNSKGEQIKVLTSFGRSKQECLGACEVYSTDKYIYVWDDMALAMLVFDKQGEFCEKYSDFNAAITKFSVLDDRYICFYKSGGHTDNVVAVYDMTTTCLVREFDSNSPLDVVLSMRSNVGGLDVTPSNKLIYCKPSELKLNIVPVGQLSADYQIKVVEIGDDQFNTVDNSQAELNKVRGNVYEAIKVGNRNGCVLDVECIDGRIYILSECGTFDTESGVNGRFNKVYVLSDDLQPVQVIELPYLQLFAHCFYNNSLYYINANTEGGGEEYSLYRIKVL